MSILLIQVSLQDPKSRSASGKSTAVRKLIFIASLPVLKGESIITGVGSTSLVMVPMQDREGFVWVGGVGPENFFYHDLPDAEAKFWTGLLVPMSFIAYTGETGYAAFLDIPAAYLYCANDRCVTLEFQRNYVERLKRAGARFEFEETVDSGHSPFLSKVKETSEFIKRVASA
jgi:pimeloyl-ACP methyl ester carboxylesterase